MDFSHIPPVENLALVTFVSILGGAALLVGALLTLFQTRILFNHERRGRKNVLKALTGIALISAGTSIVPWAWEHRPALLYTGVAQQVEATYRIKLHPIQTVALLNGTLSEELHHIPDHALAVLGETLVVVDDQPYQLTLTHMNGEWVLLEGDPQDLTEFPRT